MVENFEICMSSYRVNHIALIFLILPRMAVKCLVHLKTRAYSYHKDPPFDIKHKLMSADPFPVVKNEPK